MCEISAPHRCAASREKRLGPTSERANSNCFSPVDDGDVDSFCSLSHARLPTLLPSFSLIQTHLHNT